MLLFLRIRQTYGRLDIQSSISHDNEMETPYLHTITERAADLTADIGS